MTVAFLFWFSVTLIVYTYFGYPILVTLFAKTRRSALLQRGSPPSITLLIAAYNEEAVIEGKLRNSLALEYPRDKLQILVVSDGSSDRTPEIVGRFSADGVELMHSPERRGKMAAINRAMPHARGDVIVFSDANNYYQPDTLIHLTTPFSDEKIGAVSGSKVIDRGDGNLGASEGLYWKYESFIKKQESRLGSCTSVAGEIFALRKNLYAPPPNNIINDDFYIGMQAIRQGYRLVYVPEAKSSERVSASAKDEIIRRTRINAGRYQVISLASQVLPKSPLLVWQIASHKFMRPL
ncbi:MAG: glycosyltransferase family 2 protein, partial [Chloroflexota bacterium]